MRGVTSEQNHDFNPHTRRLLMFATRSEKKVRLALEQLEQREVPAMLPTTATLLALDDPTPNAQAKFFGAAVARTDRYIIVGASEDSTAGPLAGAVDVYDTSGTLLRRITNPTPGPMDDFGAAVAVSGDVLVVGAPFDDTASLNSGAAYVFNAATGALLRTFVNPTRTPGDKFGAAVAIEGNRVVVGAPWRDGFEADTGAAYVFDTVTGTLTASLTHANARPGEQFGTAVAIAGPRIVVSAPYANPLSTPAVPYPPGAVFFYSSIVPGTPVATVVNPNPGTGSTPGPQFGAALAAWTAADSKAGGVVVVGAPFYTTVPGQVGSAYVLDLTSGTVRSRLLSPTPTVNDSFGSAVGVSDDVVTIGARFDDAGAPDAGSAYLFNTQGRSVGTLRNPAPEAGDYFGAAVAVWGSDVVIGAPDDNTFPNPVAGAVYASGVGRPAVPAVQPVDSAAALRVSLSLDGRSVGELVRGGFRRVKGNRLRRTFTLRNDGSGLTGAVRVLMTGVTRGFKAAKGSFVLPALGAGQTVTFTVELIRQPSTGGRTPGVVLAVVFDGAA